MAIGFKVTEWYKDAGRDLPWRETRNPYLIWIAEVILQQTRIEQGITYYYRFIERFPDVFSLAKAPLDDVLKHWEGLGYYSRARNLHAAAKTLAEELKGEFPTSYRDLIHLKGIGPYTARAISSFAFGESTGVLDGNVLRVVSRVLGDPSPINEQKNRKKFQETVDQWVAGVDSRTFNHAMMDLGSTICTPTKPGCLLCPLAADCVARQQGLESTLPIKSKKLKRKVRFFHFYVCKNKTGEIAIRQRPPSGLWGGLWEVPNGEVPQTQWKKQLAEAEATYHYSFKHVFTHFDMMANVFEIDEAHLPSSGDYTYISTEKIPIFAFSKAVLKLFNRMELL